MKKFHLLSTLLPAALLLACGSDPKEPPAAPTGGTEPVSTATQTAGDDALPADECFATSAQHQHPRGGGSYYHQNTRQALKDLRTAMRSDPQHPLPDFFVYSEGESEVFLGDVELTLGHLTDSKSFGEKKGWLRLAPLYRTVYHDYQIGTWILPMSGPACQLAGLDYMSLRRAHV